MVPTTLVSLVIFVVLLLPGFTFVRRQQLVNPSRESSAFSEIATVLFAGAVFDTLVLALFLTSHKVFPALPPDLDEFVREPGGYTRAHYDEIALWTAILVLLATLAAYLACTRRVRTVVSNWSGLPPEAGQSAWWMIFDQHPDKTRHVSCALDDGSMIRGAVYSFSRVSREHADREIVLSQPLEYRPGPGDEFEQLSGVAVVTVSSRRIVTLMVSYIDPEIGTSATAEPSGESVD